MDPAPALENSSHTRGIFLIECGSQAVQVIITNPVNALTPLAAEVLKGRGVHDPRKVLGMTTLDVVRADTFVAETRGLDVRLVDVPVVGGHNAITILPLLSQACASMHALDLIQFDCQIFLHRSVLESCHCLC